ncbi:hypothetical protein PUR71_02910, partial [Streptomyces sp. SP17BM10]|nr:hypothetical protein [Streptomyces sp. SP17BM10]
WGVGGGVGFVWLGGFFVWGGGVGSCLFCLGLFFFFFFLLLVFFLWVGVVFFLLFFFVWVWGGV